MGELLCPELGPGGRVVGGASCTRWRDARGAPVPGGETLEVSLYLDSAPEMQMKLELYQVQLDIHWV